jgi:hypothetical protein
MRPDDLEVYQQLDAQLMALADEFANQVRAGGAGAFNKVLGLRFASR